MIDIIKYLNDFLFDQMRQNLFDEENEFLLVKSSTVIFIDFIEKFMKRNLPGLNYANYFSDLSVDDDITFLEVDLREHNFKLPFFNKP